MRIINVIKTGDGGVIDSIDSFAVWEEQLSDEVVKKAEERFVQIAKELGWNPEDHYCDNEDDLIEESYYEQENGDWHSVCIFWSDVV